MDFQRVTCLRGHGDPFAMIDQSLGSVGVFEWLLE